MKAKLQQHVDRYLRNSLGLEAEFTAYQTKGEFPVVMETNYDITALELQGRRFLALGVKDRIPPPATLEKHARWFEEKTQQRVIFIVDRLNAYDRKRLIQGRVPFVVPGNQLYLPDLGMDFREQLRAARRREDHLAPAAQIVVLAAVLGRMWINEEMTGAGLAEQFGYTKMTMTRALEEMRQHGWVEVEGERRFARNRFVLGRKELWEKARPHLRTPVIKRVYLDEWGSGMDYLAGEAELAKRTMLAGDEQLIGAMTKKQLDHFLRRNPVVVVPEESKRAAAMQIEVWRYDPALLAEPPYVDPLSLALSLAHIQDERVQMAIEELLKGVPW